jgi:hypothetical protein
MAKTVQELTAHPRAEAPEVWRAQSAWGIRGVQLGPDILDGKPDLVRVEESPDLP